MLSYSRFLLVQGCTVIEIFIVDDHPLIRRGLEYLVQSSPDICVCGEAADGFSALDAIPSANPDALVLDIVMPGMSGMDVLKQLRSRRIPENCIGN